MITTNEYNHICIRPDAENGETVTVRNLMAVLQNLNPDSEIIIGTGLNDCEDTITRIIYDPNQKKPGVILFATEPEEPEDRVNAFGEKVNAN